MKKNILARTLGLAAASLVAGAVPQAACAATIVYNNSATFSSQLGASFLDTYSLAQGYNEGIYSNADMSAIVGQTAYFTTRFSNSNLVGNNPIGETDGAYCGGCNGSFRFSFAETSYTVAGGVYGAGFEVNFNRPPFAQPSDTYAFVTFTNNSTANFFLAPQLTSGPGFLPNFLG